MRPAPPVGDDAPAMRWPESADEIIVHDGHLTIRLLKVDDGWRALIESSIEGKIFEGPVAEMSDLIAGHATVGGIAGLDDEEGP